MFKKAFSNLRSHWFSNLGFPSVIVPLGESVMDVFDSSFYSDSLWISVRCCQGKEWNSRHTINRVSALPQRRQKYPAAYFSRRACKLFTSLELTSLFVTNDITITCHSSQSETKRALTSGNGATSVSLRKSVVSKSSEDISRWWYDSGSGLGRDKDKARWWERSQKV